MVFEKVIYRKDSEMEFYRLVISKPGPPSIEVDKMMIFDILKSDRWQFSCV